MLCKVQLCVLLCLGAYLARASTPECSQPCNLAACSVVQCRYGTVLDLCGCCSLCGKGPGERCAANFESITFYGVCGDGLVCISPFPDLTYFPGTCTAVAGNPSSSILPQPTSTTVIIQPTSSTQLLKTSSIQVARSTATSTASSVAITTTAAIASPLVTVTSSSDRTAHVSATSSIPKPSTSTGTLVTTASNVPVTATPAPNPTNLTTSSSNSTPPAACMELCSVNYCSASSSNICSAQGNLAIQPVSQRGVCQHTACGACFILLSPNCAPCPDPLTSGCLKQYSTCISNFYFHNATNNALMRLDDPRASSVQGKILCQVSSVDTTVSQSTIRRAVRREFGLSTRKPTHH